MAYQDLLKDNSVSIENGNFFNVTITDLDINTSYPLQFRWNYTDGTQSPWSAVKIITTPGESTPATPSTLTVVGGAGLITVTWDGKDANGNTMTNIDRLDIYIDGSPFQSTKPADYILSAGTKTITAPSGTYIVAAYAVSKAGTRSAVSSPVTITVTSAVPVAQSSVTPSTPTVSSVLGAIQLSWNGKTSTGADQPYGFDAAKVYVGTTSNFTPSSSNQVDTLNFANGQNTLNIGIGTIVNSVALDYGIDYYVKIATTNGSDTSTAVLATGSPVKVGKVTSGDIVTITADKIATGTVSTQTITVGSATGKHVTLSGTGDPFTIYDTDGTTKLLSYSTTSGKLSIVGDGSFTGNLSIGSSDAVFKAEPIVGIWLGNQIYGSAPFSVSKNGVIKADSGTIGGWTLSNSYLQNSAGTFQINSNASTIYVGPYATGDHIKISASGGIQHTNSVGSATGKFTLSPNGNLTLSGAVTITSGDTYDAIQTAQSDANTANSTANSAYTTAGTAIQPGNGISLNSGAKTINTILMNSSGIKITTASSGTRLELSNSGLYLYNGSTPTVSLNAATGNAEFTGTITASTFTSTYGTTNGITIQASSGADEINFYNSSSLKLRIYSSNAGSTIQGPNTNNLEFLSGGAVRLTNSNNTLILASNSGGGVYIDTPYSSNGFRLRNISSTTSSTLPTLTSGGATADGAINGDIYLVRES
jgi:hypothetical protein